MYVGDGKYQLSNSGCGLKFNYSPSSAIRAILTQKRYLILKEWLNEHFGSPGAGARIIRGDYDDPFLADCKEAQTMAAVMRLLFSKTGELEDVVAQIAEHRTMGMEQPTEEE